MYIFTSSITLILITLIFKAENGRSVILTHNQPIIIAHRGASGSLPEESVAAFELAILQGANFVECDVVFSKDGSLFHRHEPNIINTTNIGSLEEFRNKSNSYSIDNSPEEVGYFLADFFNFEVSKIKTKQANTFRNTAFDDILGISSLEDYLCLLLRANIWREWLIFHASLWGITQTPNWTFSSPLQKHWVNSGQNSFDPFFCNCLRGVKFSSFNDSLPIDEVDSSLVFTYLRPELTNESPFFIFNDLIKPFFPSSFSNNQVVSQCFHEDDFSNTPLSSGIRLRTFSSPPYFTSAESAKLFISNFPHPFGAYIELKHSAWHFNLLKISMSEILEYKLRTHLFQNFPSYVYIQSFDNTDLIWFKKNTYYPTVQLLFKIPSSNLAGYFHSYPSETSKNMQIKVEVSNTTLMKEYATAIGPSKDLLIPKDPLLNYSLYTSPNYEEWITAGFKIHPWTFRNEYFYIPLNFNQDPYQEIERFYGLSLDGMITDFPLTLYNFLKTKQYFSDQINSTCEEEPIRNYW